MSSVEMETTRKRSTLVPAGIVISKSSKGPRMSMGQGGSVYRRSNITQLQSVPNVYQQSDAIRVSKDTVQTVKVIRGKEKHDLCHLNGVLAGHMENSRFLQATNKALADECEKLRKMKGLDQTRVKEEYIEELKAAREALAELAKQMAPLRAANVCLEDKVETQSDEISALKRQIADLNGKINKLNALLGDMEGECTTLRNQCDSVGRELELAKEDIQRLQDDNDRLRSDYEDSVTKQINTENELQALQGEHEFLDETTGLEIEELRALLLKFKDMQPQIANMWKNEFQTLVNQLQEQFNTRLADMTEEQRRRYEDKIAQMQINMRRGDATDGIVKSENKTLKSQIGDNKMRLSELETENEKLKRMYKQLQDKYDEECIECEQEKAEKDAMINDLQAQLAAIMHELADLETCKMDLQLEISCYHKLLEGEENKIQHTLETKGQLQSKGGAALSNIISGGLSEGGQSGHGGSGQMSQSSNPEPYEQNTSSAGAGKRPPKSKPPHGMSESSGTVRVSRTSHCSLIIAEIEQGGVYILLKNGSKTKDFELTDWSMERKSDKCVSTYEFPDGFKLKPLGEVKIFSYAFADECGQGDLKATQKSCRVWGYGNGTVKVFDSSKTMKSLSEIKFHKN